MKDNHDPVQNVYGCINTNPVTPGYHQARGFCSSVPWTTPGLKITRLRLLSDPGFSWWDVSYCHGELDGKNVDVSLPFSQLPRGKGRMIGALIEYAKRDNLFVKGTGVFGAISTCC